MSPEEAVRERILEITAVTDVVDDRVYQLKLPDLAPLPAVRVQMVSGEQSLLHLRGGIGIYRSRIQVDTYAAEADGGDPYRIAMSIGESIHGDDAGGGLAGFTGDIGDVRVLAIRRADRRTEYDSEERKEVRCRQDFFVDWKRIA